MVIFYSRLPKFEYLLPKTIDEALSLLSRYKGEATVMAGGTDLVPKMKRREIKPPVYIIDLKGITDLDYIKYDESRGLSLGALTTLHAVEASLIIQEKFSVLSQAVYNMGSVQVRNRGTVAGNICNAIPSADTAPALLVLEARLKLVSLKGERVVDIEDFFTGPNETVVTEEEILLEIQVPNLPSNTRGRYLRLTPRMSMDHAIVGVAVAVLPEDDICKNIRIALGAVAPTPIRARRAEDTIKGQRFSEEVIERVAQIAAEESRPRTSVAYKREMVKVLTRRAINQAREG